MEGRARMVFIKWCSSLDAGPMVDRDTHGPHGTHEPGEPVDPFDLLTHSSCLESLDRQF